MAVTSSFEIRKFVDEANAWLGCEAWAYVAADGVCDDGVNMMYSGSISVEIQPVLHFGKRATLHAGMKFIVRDSVEDRVLAIFFNPNDVEDFCSRTRSADNEAKRETAQHIRG